MWEARPRVHPEKHSHHFASLQLLGRATCLGRNLASELLRQCQSRFRSPGRNHLLVQAENQNQVAFRAQQQLGNFLSHPKFYRWNQLRSLPQQALPQRALPQRALPQQAPFRQALIQQALIQQTPTLQTLQCSHRTRSLEKLIRSVQFPTLELRRSPLKFQDCSAPTRKPPGSGKGGLPEFRSFRLNLLPAQSLFPTLAHPQSPQESRKTHFQR